ncbi:ras and Rab interactor 2-like isoform X6 [Syngnathoides biaculeatus]|uniref:ras and Rab interactor 2-like isoform X6 n=1 Tax=Syngnathoides biaculeatus TaxID=300417 RepID=UPI002ADDB751|nr:ras and Rab interactor 2-like isoform X6 [Syngnathoides biaculeatus]
MDTNTSSDKPQNGPMIRSGSFLKLIDAFALEIGELQKEMVHTSPTVDQDPVDIQVSESEVGGEVSGVYPELSQHGRIRCERDYGYDSLRRRMSVLERLTQTHPVWLLLTVSELEATRILLRQPPGVFLVRKSITLQKKVLSVRLYGDRSRSSISHFPVRESQYTFSLDGSGISFADLFRLVAFYCISRDVLPIPLKLPDAIASAKTQKDLEQVAQLGPEQVLEKAMHKCVLKPLKTFIDVALHDFQMNSGDWQQMRENLALAKSKRPQELGVGGAVPPDAMAIEKIRHKFLKMRKMYSPEKKVSLMLRVCKIIYTIMQDNSGRMYGADDFLPMLTYVIAQCEMPQLDIDIQYMMELLDPSLLQGEEGYYLTSAFGAMALIKNFQEEQAARVLSSEARNTLHQWHRRRTAQHSAPTVDDFQNYLQLALEDVDSGCTAKTLIVNSYTTAEEVCLLCAKKFKVSEPDNYALFLVTEDTCQQLAPDTHPQQIKAELHSRPRAKSFHFVYRKVPHLNVCIPACVFDDQVEE